jgi:hypothetical protein
MRTTIYSILVLLLILISCEKEKIVEKQISDGTYTGTFQRQFVWADSDTAQITLTFNGNQWSGSSDIEKYPALCKGTYSIDGDTIVFENGGSWPNEFDRSLILSGKYALTKTGKTIEFSKDKRSATADTYIDKFILIK